MKDKFEITFPSKNVDAQKMSVVNEESIKEIKTNEVRNFALDSVCGDGLQKC